MFRRLSGKFAVAIIVAVVTAGLGVAKTGALNTLGEAIGNTLNSGQTQRELGQAAQAGRGILSDGSHVLGDLAATLAGDESQASGTRGSDLGFDADQTEATLQGLIVRGDADGSSYNRESDFGEAWADIDGNGCDTRDDILARDLTDTTKDGDCTITSGTLADPYTGATIHFTRGRTTSSAVQIDHVVALKNAWQSGAQGLPAERRKELANDPLNLLAVDGPANNTKSDSDASEWLPDNAGFRCQYVERQVAVKAKYGLWVTEPEKTAMEDVLASCKK